MKEIKLRAYVKDIKKVVNVYKIDFLQENIGFMHPTTTAYTCRDFKEIELMEYTGIDDKNGVKIYEGDIVKATYDGDSLNCYQVIFYNGGFKMKSINCQTIYDYSIHDDHPDFEVIGNIYDNTELFKE